MSVTTAVVAGALVTGDADQLRALAADPAVNAVHLVVPKTSTVKSVDAFTRALDAWVATGATGQDVSIGIVDTGVDYTHATFGGPGTEAAYADAYGSAGQGAIPEGSFDPAKLLGGYDFAGPLYDADSAIPGSSPVPVPDANPIDAGYRTGGAGHGTHVAAIAAGYGVLADGTTFDGDYATLTDISDWRIGPGSAPEAGVYALKVFGDAGGSTTLTIAALDWAADPNGDNDFSDRLDVVNLSLGSDFDPVDDPENLFIERLAEIGVLTVASAGNDGDVTDVGGSPGNAPGALTVANSVAGLQSFDAVEVLAADDPTLVGLHAAQLSEDYTGTQDVTAPVAHIGEVTGCTSLAEHAEAITGRIVWLDWDDDDTARPCGTYDRWRNAEAAGAVGVLIGTTLPAFPAAIAGNEGIPGARLTAAATAALLPQIETGGVVARIGPSLRGAVVVPVPAVADTLNSGSSRGVHGSLGVVKPDVAAPGTQIVSAASGTGVGQVAYSGTSMSVPHVAGIAALIVQTHPDWSAEQVKAAVMNTATHDVRAGGSGPAYGPERVGAGRVDALDAVQAEVIAFATDAPDLVTIAFGVVPVGGETIVEHRTVTLQNSGGADRTYATSFARATATGAADVTVSPAEVTVPAGGSAEVTVTLTADPATLAREIDPTSASWYDLGGYVPREYVATLSGRLVLTPADGPSLRVPVHAAPRLVSDLTSEPVEFADAASAPLEITGRGVASGGWLSLMAPMALLASSPQVPEPGVITSPSAVGAGDLASIGFSSTAPQLVAEGYDPAAYGTLALGITTHGEWASLGSSVVPIINTDIDSDGIWDAETYVWKYGPGLDFTVVMTYALEFDPGTGYTYGGLLELYPVNGLWADYDTTVFDNDVLVVPMGLAALGSAPGDVATFVVATYSLYAPDGSGYVDVVGPFTADPYDPPVWFDGGPGSAGSLWFVGQPGADVTVHRRADVSSAELLVLHTHNRSGERAQVVTAASRDASTLVVAGPRRMPAGVPVPVPVIVRSSGATPTGTVQVLEGDRLLAVAPVVAHGKVGATLLILPRTLTPGQHQLTVRYSGNAAVAPSSASYDLAVFSAGRSR